MRQVAEVLLQPTGQGVENAVGCEGMGLGLCNGRLSRHHVNRRAVSIPRQKRNCDQTADGLDGGEDDQVKVKNYGTSEFSSVPQFS